jgi:hypothetical protein
MDVRRGAQRPGPGVQDTQEPAPAPHIMGVRRARDERVRRGTAPAVREVVLVAADAIPPRSGPGQDDLTGGDRHPQAWGLDVRDLQRGPLPEAQPTGGDQPQTHLGGRVLNHEMCGEGMA